MFGFLSPRPHGADYRRFYARLCQYQRLFYGLGALPFHSYEAVFLFECAADAGAFDAAQLPAVRCCRLSTRHVPRTGPEAEVGRFCASVALLLASVKLDDDVRDTRGLLARLGRWFLAGRFARARAYFERVSPGFGATLHRLMAEHHALEVPGRSVPLEDYVRPTAQAFGLVFGALARLPRLTAQGPALTALGEKVGAALIAFDCADDRARDARRGEYNPLASEEESRAALALCAGWLGEGAELARSAFGSGARSAVTLGAVRERVLRRAEGGPCPVPPQGRAMLLGRPLRQAAGVARLMALPLLASGPDRPPIDAVPPTEGPGALPPGAGAADDNVKEGAREAGKKASECGSNCGGCDCGAADCGGCDGCDGCSGCDGCGGCDCNCG
jgi:hypothetical protein